VHPSALLVRTDRLPAPVDSFHDHMAAHLRQAPWLVMSAAAHALVLLLLWLLIPPEVKRAIAKAVAVMDTEAVEVVQPEPEKPPEMQPEETVEQPIVEDVVVVEPREVDAHDHTPSEHEFATKESAFLSNGDNPAVGIGGGAGGAYGDRGKRGGGGTKRPTDDSFVAALTWLQRHQDEDGKWDCDEFMKHDDPALPRCTGAGNPVHDVGVTGLALLAFLGEGSTLRAGAYRDTVRRGVLWLREQQQPDGLFGAPNSSDFIYDHAIAAYAMCEAYGLSSYTTLRDSAQRGLDYLEKHRNPYGVWRYQPRDGDNDTSVTGWCVMAYCAGKHFGLNVNTGALQYAGVFFDQVCDPSGMHGYLRAGDPSSRKQGDHAARFPPDKGAAMTAVALFCRAFMGQTPKEKPVMTKAAELIASKPPVWDEKGGAIDHYYWYYGTYALFQMGGPLWKQWQQKLETAVLKNQYRDRADQNRFGSWDPVCAWGEDGGRVYSTAMLALCLQANFRYTKLIR
jgi:hypothetical protein